MGHEARTNARSFSRPRLPVEVNDAFGRPLRVGDFVMVPGQTGKAAFKIMELAPDLRPGVPNNVVRVTLVSQQQFGVPTNARTDMILIVPVEESEKQETGLVQP